MAGVDPRTLGQMIKLEYPEGSAAALRGLTDRQVLVQKTSCTTLRATCVDSSHSVGV